MQLVWIMVIFMNWIVWLSCMFDSLKRISSTELCVCESDYTARVCFCMQPAFLLLHILYRLWTDIHNYTTHPRSMFYSISHTQVLFTDICINIYTGVQQNPYTCMYISWYNASAFANCLPLDNVIFVWALQYDKLHLQTLTCPEFIWSSWHVSQRGTLDMVQSLTLAKHPLRLTWSSRGFHIIREMPTELYQCYHSRACITADTPGRRAHFKWLQIRHSMGNLNLFEVV